ncbi:rubrerythrin family protein [Pelotomaculum propionicicum]|uniref:Nigerythrin n=1 Tax=Pelotomaculum propionicicum TaxID=258475 RepID=A0A4Y7RT27_9FIRM|nr:rubrerythrin family protein [Pelotomaculum propionicicum]NLI12470.1 rubrerythrin family protein [Peptococcaceae bacterium]TEB11906.1 Nigerythrin [Pelotomaculum propionicicum]
MDTEKNLKTSIAGESQANRKYAAFAKKADEEGYPAVAKLFRAASEAEAIHAAAQLRAIGAVKSTAENLKAAIEGETYEFTQMYPGFIAKAEEEGSKQAKIAFNQANEAEKVHAALYTKVLDSLESKPEVEFYLCTVCGNIVENEAPDKCRICNAPKKAFKKVE